MTRPLVVLLTSRFPFGSGEQFIESELPHWQGKDVDLVIVPEKNDTPRVSPRAVPAGIRVDSGLTARWRSPLWRLLGAVRALTDTLLWREVRTLTDLGRFDAARVAFVLRTAIQVAVVRRYLRDRYRGADLVYAYWLSVSADAAALERRCGTVAHAVARTHNADLYEDRHPLGHHPFVRQIAADLSRLQPIAEDGAQFAMERYGFAPGSVIVNRLGVRIPTDRCAATGPGTLTLMSVSTMSRFKRLDLLIDSLACLHRDHPEVDLHWIHAGDGPFHAALADRAARCLDGVDVTWLGHLPNEELLAWYRDHRVDLLVNTSSSEGIPVSIMEAMARGIPALGTDVGGVREIVPPHWLLAPDPTPQEVADAMAEHLTLAKDPTVREAMARLIHERFDADANYERFVNGLVELARKP
ncbi:glycosyltransferase [Acidipropionibacterium timonense]|uniref:glycosyltransferase n=1 Tax=Acidipropionibacterium timonense TaxID=2161818 RepID=UPI001030B93C|nr:glycosyltransferase [Acidipropionibacterium timonense]